MKNVKTFIPMGLGLAALGACAQDSSDAWTFKFTPSVYSGRHQTLATDMNMRGHYGQHTLWLGQYTRPGEFQ